MSKGELMKIFVCARNINKANVDHLIGDLSVDSHHSIAFLYEFNHTSNWKDAVEKQMSEADFVLFVLAADTFQSYNLIWEYAKAKDLNKRIIGFKLPQASDESILYCQGYQIFQNTSDLLDFVSKTFEIDRALKLEQYRMMFESTQRVTEQRLTVNNIFFTLTTTVFGVAFVVGKTFEFDLTGMAGMIILTFLSFVITRYWQKLIESYGKLNKGKFKVIDSIEKQLRTNMFEAEWKVLLNEVNYESNTKTETRIIKNFRRVIIIAGIVELLCFLYKLPFVKQLLILN